MQTRLDSWHRTGCWMFFLKCVNCHVLEYTVDSCVLIIIKTMKKRHLFFQPLLMRASCKILFQHVPFYLLWTALVEWMLHALTDHILPLLFLLVLEYRLEGAMLIWLGARVEYLKVWMPFQIFLPRIHTMWHLVEHWLQWWQSNETRTHPKVAACRWGSVVIPWQTSVNSMAVLSLTYHNCSEMVSSSVANHISEGRAVSESSLVQISEKQYSSMGSAVIARWRLDPSFWESFMECWRGVGDCVGCFWHHPSTSCVLYDTLLNWSTWVVVSIGGSGWWFGQQVRHWSAVRQLTEAAGFFNPSPPSCAGNANISCVCPQLRVQSAYQLLLQPDHYWLSSVNTHPFNVYLVAMDVS